MSAHLHTQEGQEIVDPHTNTFPPLHQLLSAGWPFGCISLPPLHRGGGGYVSLLMCS